MTASCRCRPCNAHWPTHLNLKSCPECKGQLVSSTVAAMDSDEAEARLREAEFAWYYRDEWVCSRDSGQHPRTFNSWKEALDAKAAGLDAPVALRCDTKAVALEADREVRERLTERRELEEKWKTAQS